MKSFLLNPGVCRSAVRAWHVAALVAVSALLLLLPGRARAQTATWNGPGSGIEAWVATDKWNWTGTAPAAGLPDTATSVVVGNNGTIRFQDTTAEIRALTMNNGHIQLLKELAGGSVLNVREALLLGNGTGTVSTLVVDGAGVELNKTTSTSQMQIGVSGTGTLTLSNGGKMTSAGAVHVGLGSSNGATGTGTLNVNTGGQAIINSTFMLGHRGNGTMNIETGGYVKSTNGYLAGYGQDSNRIRGTALVKVNGQGSKWDTGILYVGHTGTATMIVEEGGAVNNTGTSWIGYFNAGPVGAQVLPTQYGSGKVTVRSGGVWQSTGAMGIGTSGSTGTLNVSDQGRVNVGGGLGTITLGAGGWLNIGADPQLEGAVPLAPGIVSAATITSADYEARTLTFFHTDSSGSYHLTKNGLAGGGNISLAGTLQVQALAGTTVLPGANTYSGNTIIGGYAGLSGRLVAQHAQSLGTGYVTVKNNGVLEVAAAQPVLVEQLTLEGGSALALTINPAGGSWTHELEVSSYLEFVGEPEEKVTLYLTGGELVTNPELYDWTFLRTSGGIFADPSMFEIVSDVPGFYVFQRGDNLVLGMKMIPEPGRVVLCLFALGVLGLRRRR